MRSEHLKPGSEYHLAGERGRIVRVVDTPPELRARACVLVEFVNGVKAGQVTELPTRRIVTPIVPPEVEPKATRTTRPREDVIRLTRRPRAGDQVIWKSVTGEDLVWTVTVIDGAIATVETELFGRPSTATTPLDDLEVRPIIRPRPVKVVLEPMVLAPDVVLSPAPPPPIQPHRFAPQKARRELDEIVDGLIFTGGCLGAYQQRLVPKARWATISDTLRSEIRSRGYVEQHTKSIQGFGCIRVDRRFDVPLARKPAPQEFEMIEYLRFWSRPRRRARERQGISR
jgi:hypothetical protein